MFPRVGTFWQRLGQRLFGIHSPAGLELHGCLVCGMPSRERILADVDDAYLQGLRSGLNRMNAYRDEAYRAGVKFANDAWIDAIEKTINDGKKADGQ